LTLPEGYKSGGSVPTRHSHKKAMILITIVVLIFIIVNVAVIWNHFNTQATVQHNWVMLEQNCFPVDATWDPVKKDYDRLPTQWDCSRDILGDPK
jgi:hypothetical protein